MTQIRRSVSAALVVALIAVGCGGGASDPEPTVAAEPTVVPEPTAAPDAQAATESDATPESEPIDEPTPIPVVLAADERSGDFECRTQEPGAVRADPELDAQLDALIGPGVPGLTAATVTSDGVVRIGAAGERSIGSGDPLLATDRMHLGSDTKSMTGALLAILGEQPDSQIGFDTLITDFWPDANAGWEGVNLLDLLQHRGGAEDSLGRDQSELWGDLYASTQSSLSASPAEQAAAAKDDRATFAITQTAAAPTEQTGEFAYSNAGYIMVGAAIEAAAGAPWEELMCEHLFRPLRMDGCGFGAPLDGPTGHRGAAGSLSAMDPAEVGSDNPIALGPAGTVHCPIADWGRYVSWVLRGAQGTDDLLPAAAWEQLLTPNGDYASGWIVSSDAPWAEGPLITHAGSNTLWFANAWVAPGLDRAYLVAANAATPEAQVAVTQISTILLNS